MFTDEGELVLYPMCSSGMIQRIARYLGRRAVGGPRVSKTILGSTKDYACSVRCFCRYQEISLVHSYCGCSPATSELHGKANSRGIVTFITRRSVKVLSTLSTSTTGREVDHVRIFACTFCGASIVIINGRAP